MSAAVALAGGIAAAVFPALDALNHGAPFAFLASIGVLGAAAWTWRRQPTQRAGSLAAAGGAALMLGLTVAPEAVAGLFTRREPPREAGPTITVATLNLWQGGRWEGQAVDYLIETNADFIVLQETGFLYRPGLLRLREAYPFAIESIAAPYAQVTLLSRRPPVAANAVAGAAWSLAAQGQPPRRLRWTEAVFAAHGRPVHLVGLHARRNGGVAATAAELDAISRTLATADDRSALIVAGDFNTTPWTHSLRRFGRAAGLRRATRQIATYPSPARGNPDWPPFAIFPIDHQFSGSGWRPVAVRRGPDVGSDHYPVIVTYQATP
jgi:endonuclease/exonuclease/phosphatase (EEP) superfamily protein YafD